MLPQLEQFNETIQQWIDQLDGYTPEQLCKPPAPGSWSLGQVYIHVINATGWFAGQMKAAVESRENGEKDMHPDARAMFVRNGFPDKLIEGPDTGTFIPQPENKESLTRQLTAIKEQVGDLFREYDPAMANGKTRHPGLLYFSPLEWLQFSEMHMRHHFKQKLRIDKVLFLAGNPQQDREVAG
jgi:DinB superfamily